MGLEHVAQGRIRIGHGSLVLLKTPVGDDGLRWLQILRCAGRAGSGSCDGNGSVGIVGDSSAASGTLSLRLALSWAWLPIATCSASPQRSPFALAAVVARW
jgi:hypothetical protein